MDSANVIGPGIRVMGTISGRGSLTIAGDVGGQVVIGGELIVAPGGAAEASLRAARVLVAGRVRGPLDASELVALQEGADVEGDITAARVDIHERARLKGRLHMQLDLPRGVRVAATRGPGGAQGVAREDSWQ